MSCFQYSRILNKSQFLSLQVDAEPKFQVIVQVTHARVNKSYKDLKIYFSFKEYNQCSQFLPQLWEFGNIFTQTEYKT